MSSTADVFGKSFTSATRIFQIFGLQSFTLSNAKGNSKFTHNGSKTSTVFLLVLFVNLTVLTVTAAVMVTINRASGESVALRVPSILRLAAVAISMIHSFCVTSKTKLIYRKSEEIFKIFEQELKFDSDSIGFSRKSKRHFVKLFLLFLIYDIMLFIFVCIYVPSDPWYLIYFVFLPNVFTNVTVLKAIFSIRLLNHNIELMRKVLERLNGPCSNDEKFIPFVKSVRYRSLSDIYPTIAIVKDIYETITEVNDLINSICAPIISGFLLMAIVTNSLAGYRCFLFLKHDVTFDVVGSKLIK